MDDATGKADAADQRGDIELSYYYMGLVVQAGNLYESLGCGGPPKPPTQVSPVVCPVAGSRVPQTPYPATNRTWCQNHPVACAYAIGGLITTGVAATCVLQPELCPIAIRVGIAVGF
jgi:hypothetical protein